MALEEKLAEDASEKDTQSLCFLNYWSYWKAGNRGLSNLKGADVGVRRISGIIASNWSKGDNDLVLRKVVINQSRKG